MRAGGCVTYVDATGSRHAATITDVVGTGPSGYKILTLVVTDGDSMRTIDAVTHVRDRPAGRECWALPGDIVVDPTTTAIETASVASEDSMTNEVGLARSTTRGRSK